MNDLLDSISLIQIDNFEEQLINCDILSTCDYCDCDRYDGCDDGNYDDCDCDNCDRD